MHSSATLPFAALLLSIVSAQATSEEIVSLTGCVDASGFTKCMAASVSNEQECLKKAESSIDKDSCGCVGSVQRLNCFGESCWNKVYSCEYQAAVLSYSTCPIAAEPIPFWPAPTDGPGGCSCNTGQVAKAVLGGAAQSLECVQNATSGFSLTDLASVTAGCGCCTASVAFSAFANICPDTDPTLIGLGSYTSQLTSSFSWDSCSSSLEKYDCVKDLGFAAPSSGSLYNPSNLPATGTKTLSNVPGEVTSPVSGATYSWSAAGSVWTVTAVSAEGKAATTTETGGSSTESAGSVASGTSSASGSATPSSGAEAVALSGIALSGKALTGSLFVFLCLLM